MVASIAALVAILALFIDPLCNLAVLTELSAGTFKLVAEPICIINIEDPVGKLLPKIIVLLSTIANPSEGAEVPVFGFCITPLMLTINCAAFVTVAAEPLVLPSLRS